MHRLAFLLVLALVAAGCGSEPATPTPEVAPSSATRAPTSPAPTATVPATPAVTPGRYDPRVVAAVPVPSMPRGLAVHRGRVWVASARSGEVVAIDPATNTVEEAVAVGPQPITLVSTTADLWVTVLNGDPTGASTELVRIDPEAAEATDRVAVPAFHAVPVGAGAAWAMGHDGLLRRFDPAAGEVTDEIEIAPGTRWVGADDDAVWGARGDGTAWRLDPATLAVTHEIDLGFPVPGRSRVAVGHGRFWVSVPRRLVALDAATGEVLFDRERPTDDLIDDLDVDADGAWLSVVVEEPGALRGEGRLVRLDEAGEVTDEYPLGPVPSELDRTDDAIWIGDQQDVVVLRIER